MQKAIGLEWQYQVLNQSFAKGKECAGETTTARVFRDGKWSTVEFKLGDTRDKKGKFITCERDNGLGSNRK